MNYEDKLKPWSEEDEKILSNIVDCIKNLPIFYESININGEDKTTERFICDAINWLKSLKNRVQPQSNWKPSEEQMKILNEVLNFAANHESPYWNDYIFGTLNNLIRQLKKLKE